MLELRPGCEHCDRPLPPDSTEAMICSYECTFCRDCVERLHDVCPNCGGGFVPRPIRPAREWKPDVFLGRQPASGRRVFRPVDLAAHEAFAASLREVPPERR
jgi:hypothetical protein